jgi:hypothetical protein
MSRIGRQKVFSSEGARGVLFRGNEGRVWGEAGKVEVGDLRLCDIIYMCMCVLFRDWYYVHPALNGGEGQGMVM